MITPEHVFAAVSAVALAAASWSASEVIDHKVKIATAEVRVNDIHTTLQEIRTDVKMLRAYQQAPRSTK